LSTFSMLLPSMGMAAPPTACPHAWLSRLSGRRARANRVGVRRWAAVAPQVIATLEISGLAWLGLELGLGWVRVGVRVGVRLRLRA